MFYLLHLCKVVTFCCIVFLYEINTTCNVYNLENVFNNLNRVICYNGAYASSILGISYAKP